MKSKDVIKLLKEEDPTGETHVRFAGGEITFVDNVPGYYDGPYTYKDEQGRLVLSKKGRKIDVHYEDILDVVWEHEGDMDVIKEHVVIDLYDEKANREYWEKTIAPDAEKARHFHQESLERYIFTVLKKLKEGYIITQPINTQIGHYHKMSYEKGKETTKLCQGECGAVLKSGFFHHTCNGDRYQWRLTI
jgi:hypothetical protein